MPLGTEDAAWAALFERIRDLCEQLGATHTCIFDDSRVIWCAYHRNAEDVEPSVTRLYEHHVAPIGLRRGARLAASYWDEELAELCVAESFAGVYVLGFWFPKPAPVELAIARIRRALPRIEALTLALPPPDGSDPNSAAGKLRA